MDFTHGKNKISKYPFEQTIFDFGDKLVGALERENTLKFNVSDTFAVLRAFDEALAYIKTLAIPSVVVDKYCESFIMFKNSFEEIISPHTVMAEQDEVVISRNVMSRLNNDISESYSEEPEYDSEYDAQKASDEAKLVMAKFLSIIMRFQEQCAILEKMETLLSLLRPDEVEKYINSVPKTLEELYTDVGGGWKRSNSPGPFDNNRPDTKTYFKKDMFGSIQCVVEPNPWHVTISYFDSALQPFLPTFQQICDIRNRFIPENVEIACKVPSKKDGLIVHLFEGRTEQIPPTKNEMP